MLLRLDEQNFEFMRLHDHSGGAGAVPAQEQPWVAEAPEGQGFGR